MDPGRETRIPEVLNTQRHEVLAEWVQEQVAAPRQRADLINEGELRRQSGEFLALLSEAARAGELADTRGAGWAQVRGFLKSISNSRALQGFSAVETATFVFSLKQPLLRRLLDGTEDKQELARDVWILTSLLDELGLYTTEVYQKSREEVIQRQQQELLELSTPVVKLWQGILAVPLIGTLDSARTQVIMENLLQQVLETGSEIIIIDITGVPTVDTLVAQHLLKTVAATRLMGAECIISGIRPQIAQTIVHLGVELQDVVTKASLADAFLLALGRTGASIRSAERR